MAKEWDGENDVTPAGEWMADAPYGGDGQLSHWTAEVNSLGGKVKTANITVTTYHGADDGKPVVQIDTGSDVDLRVNVNDGTVFNDSVDGGHWDVLHDAALSWLNELQESVLPSLRSLNMVEDVAEFEERAAKLAAALAAIG